MSGLKLKVSRLVIGVLALELSLWAGDSGLNHANKAQLPVANACVICTANGCEDGGTNSGCQDFPNSESNPGSQGCVSWGGCDKGPGNDLP